MKQQYLQELKKRGIRIDMSREAGGSFCKVYFGQRISDKLKVAIKQIILEDNDNHPSAERQITILQQCDHPNIVKLYEVIVIGNTYLLIMECGECSLQKYILEKELSIFKKIQIIRQITDACYYLYRKNIMHRDIKLQNIIKIGHTYKLIDFGFAIQADIDNPVLTSYLGNRLGKSPEIYKYKHYDYKSDIWSLGVLFYCILYKKPPYNGDVDNMEMETALPICQNTHPTERDLINLIRECLRYRPEDRPMWSEIMSHPAMKDSRLTKIIFGKDILHSTILLQNSEDNVLNEMFTMGSMLYSQLPEVVEKAVIILKKILLYKQVFLDFVSAWIKTYLTDSNYEIRQCLVPFYSHISQMLTELISFLNPPKMSVIRELNIQNKGIPYLSVDLFTRQETEQFYNYDIKIKEDALDSLVSLNKSIDRCQVRYSRGKESVSKILPPQMHPLHLSVVQQCLVQIQNIPKTKDGKRDELTLLRLVNNLKSQSHRPLMNDIVTTDDIEQFAQHYFRASVMKVQ